MKIIHLSDPHSGGAAEEWRAYFDKRIVGVFNYTFRRRRSFDLSRLKRAVAYIVANPPDAVVCSGDLTSTGQPGEFRRVLDLLLPLREAKIPIIYTPGNHDYYVKRKICTEALQQAIKTLMGEEYGLESYPFRTEIAGAEFLVVNTAAPSNLLCSWGFFKRRDIKWLQNVCESPKTAPRILVTHYPVYEKNAFLRTRHRLFGGKTAWRIAKSGGLDLILCGHVHSHRENTASEHGGVQCIAGSVTRNGIICEIEVNAGNPPVIKEVMI